MAKQNGGGQELDFSTWVPSERIPGTWYVIHALVDEGGHGRLYRAQHEITGRVCAFKAIHRKYKTMGDLTARLKQEARINTSLSGHPNIAEVFEAGVTEDGRTYCVMQWLEGANLRNMLKNGLGLDAEWSCFVIKSVLAALARAHSVDIVHRDIKPENIFLCDDGLVKLIDFGVAKVLNSKFVQTGPGKMPGTIRYMSPEAVDGQPATSTCDIYSLGVVFWELLAGEHPFPQPNPQQAAHAIVRDGVAPLDKRPAAIAKATPALREVVMRACALDPADRFPSAEAFADAIDLAMGYAPSARPLAAGLHPPSDLESTPAPKTRQRAILTQATEAEQSPGSALEVWHPTPRVALTDQAPLSLVVKDPVADAGQLATSVSAHRSSVLMRGQGVDSDQMPPRAPWLSGSPNTTPGRAGGGSQFGVLSHVPPFLHELPDSNAPEERTPNSTPPLVSGTSPRAGAHVAAADDSDEATTLPQVKGAAGSPPPGGRARPFGPFAGRLLAARGGSRALAAGAGVLAIAALAFALGQSWRPIGPGVAAPAAVNAAGQAPAVTRTPLAPALPPGGFEAPAALTPEPAQRASAAAPAQESTPPQGPPAVAGAPSASAGAAALGRAEAQAPKTEEPQAGAPRRSQAKPPPRGPRLLPKGGIEPGF